MTGLTTLLEDAATHPETVDVTSDVRRGHRALHRRRVRVATGLTGGLAVLGVAGTATVHHLTRTSTVQVAAEPSGPVHTSYFDTPAPPEGWNLAAAGESFLTLARDGAADPHPQVFDGKIALILYSPGQDMGFGSTVRYDGRTFYDNERNDGYPILAVQLDDGRWLQLQYPDGAGLEKSQMIAYLDGVVVQPAATGSRG
jgi:hypothetical protein